jgi:hypothetical protein
VTFFENAGLLSGIPVVVYSDNKSRERKMKSLAVILSLAISAVALSSAFTPAAASRMNGKCCLSSDGGRSYRARVAINRRILPYTCSAYAASCIRVAHRRGDGNGLCRAAKAQCLRSGVHAGPYSGRQIAGLEKR